MKIVTVVGARPQFVKAAVLSRAIKSHPNIQDIIVHTGQHFDANMSDVFFEEMEIPRPNYFLGINGLGHGAMTGRMLEEIEKLLLVEKPDYVVVYGDTNSTLAAVLAAKKLGISPIHIEAGVRNFDEYMPEEINRYLVDRMAEMNFCCSGLCVDNLEKEGYKSGMMNTEIYNYGDVMYDAALYYEKRSDATSTIISTLGLTGKDYVACTVHRANNTDDPKILSGIVSALNTINEQIPVVLPLHPRTRAKMNDYGLKANFTIIDPVGYFDMLQLVKHAKYVITDSGGVVREAYFLGKPSLQLLDKPVWPELMEHGYCINTLPEEKLIIEGFAKLDGTNKDFSTRLFGDGNAGEKILNEIINHYQRHKQ
jgi:UDP-GlcNAc3NAcA epimerase